MALGLVTQEIVAGAVARSCGRFGRCGRCGRQREGVKSIFGSRGTHEKPAGMPNEIKAPEPYALSVVPFMAHVLLITQ